MTFLIIAAVILATALVILILSICVVSGEADKAMIEGMQARASVPGREKWEARMAPYFDDEMGLFEEDES